MVPTNSKRVMKGDLVFANLGRGLIGAAEVVEGSGWKPWDVGMLERIRAWFRAGTWNTAHGRGVKSHLVGS